MIRRLVIALAVLLPMAACQDVSHGHSHDEDGNEHARPEDERPTVVVTLYQSDLELFMEYPALVKGEPSKLIAHFTSTANPTAFAAVTQGRVTVSLGDETFAIDAPARAGVFLPIVTPGQTGSFPLSLKLEGEQVSGVIAVGRVKVFASKAAAVKASPTEDEGGPTVSYLKEAQWKTDYATSVASVRVMRGGVFCNGKLKPVPGKSAELSAPVRGLLVAAGSVPHVGMKVTKGQRLIEVAPLGAAAGENPATLALALDEARSGLSHAKRERDRINALVEAKALPEKTLFEADKTLAVAEARARAAARRTAALRSVQRGGAVASRFALTSPIEGEIAFAEITPGAIVTEGQRLISVVQTDRLWLEAKVYEDDAVQVSNAPGAAFSISGVERTFETEALAGVRVAVGPVVDEISRTVPLIFAIDNPGRLLKPGMYAKVTVYSGDTVKGISVPETALLDDGGHPSVFVMKDGETFERRRVRPGVRSGGFVQILSGLAAGERIVSRGAYEVKLAASGDSAPAHGHAH